jgi:hypothetical protein
MAERKTIRKWYWVWDFDKEERWLNQMAASGWALVEVGFCRYTFEKCEPGAFIVRLQMLKAEEDYVAFLEEIGAEYVGRVLQWVYFRRSAEEGPFELFSDTQSRLDHLNWIARMLLVFGMMNLVVGVVNAFNVQPIGAINVVLATLLMYGLGRIHGKIEQLELERTLHE